MDYRNSLQYTVEELSEMTGITKLRYQSIEREPSEPTEDEILILSDFFKDNYQYFISNATDSANENIDSLYREFRGEFSKEDRRSIQDFLFLCQCDQEIWDSLNLKYPKFVPKRTANDFKIQNLQIASEIRTKFGYNDNHLIENLFGDFRTLVIHHVQKKA